MRVMYTVRLATLDDFHDVFRRTKAFNVVEEIEIADAALEAGLRRLLAEPSLGGAWLVLHDGAIIGHAVVTYGYDLEYGGADSVLTEFWIDEDARGGGAGAAALELIIGELRARDVKALHLHVRPENPAMRLYTRAGFVTSPRLVMSRPL